MQRLQAIGDKVHCTRLASPRLFSTPGETGVASRSPASAAPTHPIDFSATNFGFAEMALGGRLARPFGNVLLLWSLRYTIHLCNARKKLHKLWAELELKQSLVANIGDS